MAFIPRLTQNTPVPMMNNPDWYSNNRFYNIPTDPPHDFGLPNCTCYALGRWIELFRDYNIQEYPDTSLNSAWTWYTHSDRYERGQTVRLGAIACWRNISSGGAPGHVAVVEQILQDGSYITSNSNYGRDYFVTYHVTADNRLVFDPDLDFMGFIYLPVNTSGKLPIWLLRRKRYDSKPSKYGNTLRNGKLIQRLKASIRYTLGKLRPCEIFPEISNTENYISF